MVDLSIIIPSIRTNKWEELISSVESSCTKHSWEVIFIGPEDNLTFHHPKVKFIKDFGSPNICQHKAMQFSEGKTLHIFSDDCLFEKGAIDECLNSKAHAVVANYDEGGDCAVANFSLNYCYAKTITPDSFVIFNTAFMERNKFFELGGFDCQFETLCVAQADLAARWQFAGFDVELKNIKLSSCGHMPETSGDHAPMHYAQILHDIPLYSMKYSTRLPPLHIHFNNYQSQPKKWARRYG